MVLRSIDDANAGRWRSIAVRITGSDVKLPDPIKVPELMEEFIEWLHETKEHPIKIATDAHFKLVSIHPFVDGNGRTARLLMNLILISYGYPPVIIKADECEEYISLLERAQKTGDEQGFYDYIQDCVDRSLDIYLDAAEKTLVK